MTTIHHPLTCVGSRPSTPNGACVQLVSDELLNDHPVLLEYLAKHVLMAGFKEAQQVGIARVIGQACARGWIQEGSPGLVSVLSELVATILPLPTQGGQAGGGPVCISAVLADNFAMILPNRVAKEEVDQFAS